MPSKKLTKEQRQLRLRLGRNILTIRKDKKWTQEEAAHRIGLHFRHLQKLEYGDANVTLDTLAKLSKGFNLDVSDLLKIK